MIKKCQKCKLTLSIEDFFKDKSMPDGLQITCKPCCKNRDAEYRKTEKRISYMKRYFSDNAERIREYSRNYIKEKRKTDPQYNLTNRVRSLLRKSISSCGCEGIGTIKNLEYSIKELKENIEGKFTDDMSWEYFLNGDIEIDHKLPISSFSYSSPSDESFKQCWSLENLQPLWKSDNREKYNKIL